MGEVGGGGGVGEGTLETLWRIYRHGNVKSKARSPFDVEFCGRAFTEPNGQ